LAEHDLTAMAKYKTLIEKAGNALCVDPAVIAGNKKLLLVEHAM